MDQPLLTTTELAAYLQVTVNTIHQWRHRHEGPPAAKVGRSLRFRKSDVDAWITQQTTAAA